MRRLGHHDYRRMPWKNGGGITTELVVEQGTDVDERFLYRVSIADVAANGPFSRFSGYDRHIMLLDGAGMTLDCGAHGRLELAPLAPQTFSGDWEVSGVLRDGPVRDFNLIVDRARAVSSLEAVPLASGESWHSDEYRICIVHVLSGAITDATHGETLVLEAPRVLTALGPAQLVVGRITLEGGT